jgi:tRNA threonylcarbamoyladenosine biosynthesis protein TsaE
LLLKIPLCAFAPLRESLVFLIFMQINLPNLAATQMLGTAIAANLRAGDVIALSGDLGAGKTTLARAIITALGYQGEVPSPTFTIIETYDPPTTRIAVVHADFYRLQSPAEAEELGLDDYRHNAALIAEWPDHAGGFAHEAACLSLHICAAQETVGPMRWVLVDAGKDWLERRLWTTLQT